MATDTFIQWKGTNLCMDMYCECGHHSHLDGFFAYNVRCPNCGVVYRMPTALALEPIDPADDDIVLMDASEAIAVDGEWTASISGSISLPWGEMKAIKSYSDVRASEYES